MNFEENKGESVELNIPMSLPWGIFEWYTPPPPHLQPVFGGNIAGIDGTFFNRGHHMAKLEHES